MKTFKLQFHEERAKLINNAVAARGKALQEPSTLHIEWHPWEGQKDILECELNPKELEIVSEALYIWGTDGIATRGVMDKIIFKLLLEHIH